MKQNIYKERRQAMEGLHYLPLCYLIPDEIASKRKLANFPRDTYIAATEEHWREVYHSKHFQVTLMDTWGWMMWQCLGIHGGIDRYSKNDPFVQMTFCLPMWAVLLSEMGINLDVLASFPQGTELPFLSMEQAAHNCDQFAKIFWNHPKLRMREVWEVVKTHRDHRDYSGIPSHVKMDFQRKYYHTRAKTQVFPTPTRTASQSTHPTIPTSLQMWKLAFGLRDSWQGLESVTGRLPPFLQTNTHRRKSPKCLTTQTTAVYASASALSERN